MRIIIMLILIISISVAPATAHGFGIFKYAWDAMSNQLGLDRGPVPKTAPKSPAELSDNYARRIPNHVYKQWWQLQAEGF
jgi:hypothetical protein